MGLYKKILTKAVKITWDNKYLWFFGLFATFLSAGSYEMIFRGFSNSDKMLFPSLQKFIETGFFSGKAFVNFGQIMNEDAASYFIALIIMLIILILIFFVIWLAVVSQVAIVNNAAAHIAGKKKEFSDGMMVGKEKFWPVLGINIFLKVILYIIFILVSLLVVMTIIKQGGVLANLVYIISYIIFIPVVLAASFIAKYATGFIVLKGADFVGSIKSGCKLFIDNWLISLEMAFILFFINFVATLLVALVILTMSIPFFFLIVAFVKLSSVIGFWIISALAFTAFIILVVLVGSVLTSFQITSWTGLFVQLVGKGGRSKLDRVAEIIKNKFA